MRERIETSKVKFSDYKPYNTQNVLIRQVNFPVAVHVDDDNPANGDLIGSAYVDRVSLDVRDEAMSLIPRKEDTHYPECSMEHYLKTCNEDDFMRFCQTIAGEWSLGGKQATGARVVMFTNVSNGFPCPRFDLVVKHHDTPNEEVDSQDFLDKHKWGSNIWRK
jgi:hypothetical protein